jgi:hypothetical protein
MPIPMPTAAVAPGCECPSLFLTPTVPVSCLPCHLRSVSSSSGTFRRHNRLLSFTSFVLGVFVLALGGLLFRSLSHCKRPAADGSIMVCTHGGATYTQPRNAHQAIIVTIAAILLCQLVSLVFCIVNCSCWATPPVAENHEALHANVVRACCAAGGRPGPGPPPSLALAHCSL